MFKNQMNKVVFIFVCIVFHHFCYAQVDYSEDWGRYNRKHISNESSIIDVTKQIIYKKNLASLLKGTYPGFSPEKEIIPLYGLLGDSFNKIEFVFTEVKKSKNDHSLYRVKGKTKCNGSINDFKGEITFKKVIANTSNVPVEVALIGTYKLIENSRGKDSGAYMGQLKMILFTNNIYADDVSFDMDATYEDGAVRGFVGVKKNYKENSSQSCIWGFRRFPYKYAKHFDIGDGEEVINLKYAKPWFNFSKKKWDSIVNEKDRNFYLHTSYKDKGIHTSNEKYIKPENVSWYKLNSIELENRIIKTLNLSTNKIEVKLQKELSNNETLIILGEVEGAIFDTDDYRLTSHIVIVNSVTGNIKNYFSENSKGNGWISNAEFIDDIRIDTKRYELSVGILTFGIITSFRTSSQSNPYRSNYLSLYTKEGNKLKKVLDNIVLDEYSGEATVNKNACYSNIKTKKNELVVRKSVTNGYHDILIEKRQCNLISEINSEGDCNQVEKECEKKTFILRYNTLEYKQR
ncbi:conserved hypothetical protein [Tenacibaculum halocynthiae]